MNPKNVKEYPLLKKLQDKDIIERYSRTSYNSPRRVDNTEINDLTQKISELEEKLKVRPNESTQLTLARYKTQLSNPRSQRAITSSALTSASIKSTMNMFVKTWELDEAKRTQKIEEKRIGFILFSQVCSSK